MRLPRNAPWVAAAIAVVLIIGFLLASQPGATPAATLAPTSSASVAPLTSASALPSPSAVPSAVPASTGPSATPGDATSAPPTQPPATLEPTPGPTPRPGLDGAWTGTWHVTEPTDFGADFSLFFEESGGALLGQVTTGDGTSIDAGALTGIAAGNDLSFFVRQREVTMSFVGTRSGSTITGTFEAVGCTYTEGTWTVTRA